MAAATNMITTRPKPSPDKTISRKRSNARLFMIRPTADSSARFANGWNTGPSCGRSAAEPISMPLFTDLDEIQNFVGQARIRGVDRIHLRDMTVLRQHDRVGAPARAFADRLFQELELLYEPRRVQFGGSQHQRCLRR